MSDSPKAQFRIMKFGGKSCGYCVEMKANKVLEKFVTRHPEVKVVELDVNDENGEVTGVEMEAAFELSDEYNADSLPTVIFEARGVGEVLRMNGAPTLKELEAAYREILDAAAVSEKTPW